MKELRFSRKEAVGCRDSWIAMPAVLSKVTAARVNFGKGTDERGKLDNFLSKRKARTDDDRTTSFNEFYWRGWQHDLIAELTKARRTEGVAMMQEGGAGWSRGGGGGGRNRQSRIDRD